MKKRLMLIDGHSILNRAYYGLPQLTAPDGTPTGAIYGFLNIIFKFMEEDQPEYAAVAFDLSAPTFRHKLYDGYKGTRKPMDQELKIQVPLVQDILKMMNIPILSKEGYEADDVIGTIAKEKAKSGYEVIIISGDKDLLQLVDDGIVMKNPKTSKGQTTVKTYTANDVMEEYGVTPEEFVLLKAIMGDTSDNIPGVKGVGPKTAAPIVSKYHTLDNVISSASELKPDSLRKKMTDGIDSIKLSYELAKIDINVPVKLDMEEAGTSGYFNSDVYKIFEKYNFRSLLKKFNDKKTDFNVIQNKIPDINKISDLKKYDDIFGQIKEHISKNSPIGISIKISEKNDDIISFLSGRRIIYMAVCMNDEEIFLLEPNGIEESNQIIKFIESLSSLKNDAKNYSFYINDIKKASKVFDTKPEKTKSKDKFNFDIFFDISLAAYLLDPVAGSYAYDDISGKYLGIALQSEKEYKDKPEICVALDAFVAYKSGPILDNELKDSGVYDLYFEIEKPLTPILASMEQLGIRVDKTALKDYDNELAKDIEKLTADIHKQAGEEFNINSTKVLGKILFEKLGISHGKKTKTGYSTSAEVLEKLSSEHEIVRNIMEYRTLTKLKSTYTDGLYSFIGEDERIHCDFNQTVTATGRLSSANPNLQNIPVRMEIGKRIRKVFIPKDEFIFIDADYSQIELRILAHMSGDEELIRAYNLAEDIHAITASKVFNVPIEEVTPAQRRNAKAVNFGIIYGISSFGLGKDLSISVQEAKSYIDNYFYTYPKIKLFLDGLVESAKEKGYTETLWGRRRPVPELKSSNYMTRQFGERVAMNAPIQGTAADIMKLAMIRTYNALKDNNLRSNLLLQVHDELLVEAHQDEKDHVIKIISDAMTKAASLSVPLTIDIGIGENWLDAH